MDTVYRPRVPLEVQERIIWEGEWTGSDLLRASLVCQHWYKAMMERYWAVNPLKLDAGHHRYLRPLLDNPKCRFMRHIQHLLIQGRPHIGDDFYDELNDTLILLAKFKLQLQSIRLKTLRYHFMLPETISFLIYYNKVPSLEFRGVVFTDPLDFLNLLSIFAGLQSLVFHYCLLLTSEETDDFPPVLDLCSLQRLDIMIDRSPAIEEVIQQFLVNPCGVVTLNLTWMTTWFDGRDAMAELVRHIGPTLKSFHLDVSVAARREKEENFGQSLFQLTNNTSLTHLSIESIEIACDTHYDHHWLDRLLGSINSRSFQHLRIGFLSSTEWEGVHEIYFDNFDWEIIDDTLTSNSHFSRWKKVELCVRSMEDVELGNEDVEAQFREHLPKLNSSGKLVVTQETIPEEESDDEDGYY